MEDSTSRPYYPSLDGVRGLAILLVVSFHNFGFIKYFSLGWLGVDLFFVLSGYLITDILYKTLGSKNYLKNFYIKRVLRIFPLYYTTLFLTIFLFATFPSLQDNLLFYRENQWFFWVFLQNWLFVIKTPEETNFLLHFWSLAVEEQFYLMWPLIILLVRKPKPLILLLAIFLFTLAITRVTLWINQIEDLKYFNLYTFTRMDGICVGCILSLTQQINFHIIRRRASALLLSIVCLNIAFVLANRFGNFNFPYYPFVGYLSFSIGFALLIYLVLEDKKKILNTLFNQSFLRALGKISFGLYVFHWPIYVSLNPPLTQLLNEQMELPYFYSQLGSSIILTAIGLLASMASYRLIELKFLKMREHFL